MDLHKKTYRKSVDGKDFSLELSKVAGQANAAVIGRSGDTAVLATVVMSQADKPGDFFPLTVDYEERFYAAGKIIGSRFIRREGRPSDEAILSARLIDRTIRPLFDPRLRREVQVVVTVLAYDEKNDPDEPALLAASTALAVSDIPWGGPVAGLKIEEGEDIKGFFAGTEKFVNMIEFSGKETNESIAERIFVKAHENIGQLIDFQKEIIKELGKPKADVTLAAGDPVLTGKISGFLKPELEEALKNKTVGALKDKLFEHLKESGETEESLKVAEIIFEDEVDKFVHDLALKEGKRADGRKLDEIRELYAEVGLFNRTHGSALFIRGETQVLAITTLAAPGAEQIVETMETTGKKRFMLHYNFPGFAVGETSRSRGPGRREIGHGNLAQKGVGAMLPPMEEFPYTIRVVAETLSSNGSSSMASTCAASLSLMDAGVPMKKQVAGISIGLMTGADENEYKLLTDIQGPEDHYGDMDFKVSGTREGINAIQMDVKIGGITQKIFTEALQAAQKARFQILDLMDKTLAAPRKTLSPYAPKITIVEIPQDKIGELIGPGGKTINGILAETENKVTIDIEEDGHVYIAGLDDDAVKHAVERVRQITKEYHVGEIVEGPIVRILDFGAIVDLGGGQDGMIHVSELRNGYVKKVEDVVKLGDVVKAKIVKIENGKLGLSLKALNQQ
ncbi:polyribonucleotide nucleotidyltransferase [Patescibacteria group bacterium]|nr:polyribonucleotide nucleotidyltransferase [Patescibacteria group bacterium]MCL5114266.1 polyribonucleotide nucleotidyltransferase [Patescibacteria group bacterium]